jgi:hypothetical protein
MPSGNPGRTFLSATVRSCFLHICLAQEKKDNLRDISESVEALAGGVDHEAASRVARWYIFKPKISISENFGVPSDEKMMVNFMAFWSI